LKTWSATLLKLVAGGYFLLTSLYCLLAFLPYTYYALVKAPAYEWMPWFTQHHAALYWIAAAAALFGFPSSQTNKLRVAIVVYMAGAGFYVTTHPFMAGIQNDSSAYFWSLMALSPLLLLATANLLITWPRESGEENTSHAFSSGALVAVSVAFLYAVGSQVRTLSEKGKLQFRLPELELTGWSIVSHVVLALIVLTVLNFFRFLAGKTSRPAGFKILLNCLLAFGLVASSLSRFLENALGFEGWQSHIYAVALAATLTLLGLSVLLPLLRSPRTIPGTGEKFERVRKGLFGAIALASAIMAVLLPAKIHTSDWNGVLQSALTLIVWGVLAVCAYRLRQQRAQYSATAMLAVMIVSGAVYKGLQVSEIVWARPLGHTDDEVSRSLDAYAEADPSFQLVHHMLGNGREERCSEFCRILREYTNIRDARANRSVSLVDSLVRTGSKRPNIFIFTIDSLRPDYLGAYNPKADFTPHLDEFARESVVVHNAFTQYAGTTLSEPAIWSGTMLLHAHYLQPFSNINSLEKLAHADDYQLVVSYDTVLSQILSPSPDLIKLDSDKPLWNHFEACSTTEQLETVLDARTSLSRPVLFYAQPMNVHQFANNNMPPRTAANWRTRPGFNIRVAYEVHQVDECVGKFIAYLKAKELYDNSIVILTSDHGDATGEFGRSSHSTTLFPEIMRVPLIVHMPREMQHRVVYDDSRVSTLTDITPTLYYLLGHKPIVQNPFFGRPIFAESVAELEGYARKEIFMASDVHAAYGILTQDGRYLYFTADSPANSYLYDLVADPKGEHNLADDANERLYNQKIIEHLQAVAQFYDYKPQVGSLLAASK